MSLMIYREYLADTHALVYLHMPELRDLLVLILSKIKIRVSPHTLAEFLAYIHFKHREAGVLESALNLLTRIYTVEELSEDVILKVSTMMSDLVRKGETVEFPELYNAALAALRNIPILTDDPLRYAKFMKYNVTAISIEDFVEQFKTVIASKST